MCFSVPQAIIELPKTAKASWNSVTNLHHLMAQHLSLDTTKREILFSPNLSFLTHLPNSPYVSSHASCYLHWEKQVVNQNFYVSLISPYIFLCKVFAVQILRWNSGIEWLISQRMYHLLIPFICALNFSLHMYSLYLVKNFFLSFFAGGILTPAPTPTSVSPTVPQEPVTKPTVPKLPTPLPVTSVSSLSPETSPLGILSPSATTAAVSMAMNGAKRVLGTSQENNGSDGEPDEKRPRSSQEVRWSSEENNKDWNIIYWAKMPLGLRFGESTSLNNILPV